MATTSIWRVNGWLGKVLIYIENPDKTEILISLKSRIWMARRPRAYPM